MYLSKHNLSISNPNPSFYHAIKKAIADGDFSRLEAIAESTVSLDKPSIEALINGTESKNWRIRHRCFNALAQTILSTEQLERLRHGVRDEQEFVRRSAYRTLLSQFPQDEEISKLIGNEIVDNLANSWQRFDAGKLMAVVYETEVRIPAVFENILEKVGSLILDDEGGSYQELTYFTLLYGIRETPTDEYLLLALEELMNSCSGYVGFRGIFRQLFRNASKHERYERLVAKTISETGYWGSSEWVRYILDSEISEEMKRRIIEQCCQTLGEKYGSKEVVESLKAQDCVELILAFLSEDAKSEREIWLIQLLHDISGLEHIQGADYITQFVKNTRAHGRRIRDTKVVVEHTFGQCVVAEIERDDDEVCIFFIEEEGPLNLGKDAQQKIEEDVREKLIHAMLLNDFNFTRGSIQGRKDEGVSFKLSWGNEIQEWRAGEVSKCLQYDLGWKTLATSKPVKDFVSDCVNFMRVAAYGMNHESYEVWAKEATDADVLSDLQTSFSFLKDITPVDEDDSEQRAEVIALLDTVNSKLEEEDALGEESLAFYTSLIEKLKVEDLGNGRYSAIKPLQLILESKETGPLVKELRSRLVEHIGGFDVVDKSRESDECSERESNRFHYLSQLVTSFTKEVQTGIWLKIGQQSSRAQIVHHCASYVYQTHPEEAVLMMESALAGHKNEPSSEFLQAFEVFLLHAGKTNEAQRIRELRDGSTADNQSSSPSSDEDSFNIATAIQEMTDIGNECYRILVDKGTLKKHKELAQKGAELQLRVLEFWKPHSMSGAEFPKGRAVSQNLANYIDCLVDRKEYEEGAEFFMRASADHEIIEAQYRDFSSGFESYLGCGLLACIESTKEEHRNYACEIRDFYMLQQFEPERPWIRLGFAGAYAHEGDLDGAFEQLALAADMGGASRKDLKEEIENKDIFKEVCEDSRYVEVMNKAG